MKKLITPIALSSFIVTSIITWNTSLADVVSTPDGVYCDNGCDVYRAAWDNIRVCDSGTTNCAVFPSGTRIIHKPGTQPNV